MAERGGRGREEAGQPGWSRQQEAEGGGQGGYGAAGGEMGPEGKVGPGAAGKRGRERLKASWG